MTTWKLVKNEKGPYDAPYKVWTKGKDRISLWGLTSGKIDPKKRLVKSNIRIVYKVNNKKYKNKVQAMNAVRAYMRRSK